MPLPFRQVNVFSAEPFLGNPVAVVHDADALTDEQMAAFARWTNLSETTFLLRPTDSEADYRLRIFTPAASCRSPGTRRSGRPCLARGRGRAADAEQRRAGVRRRAGPAAAADGRLAFAAPPLIRVGPGRRGRRSTDRHRPRASAATTSWTASGSTTARAGSPSCCATPPRCWRSTPTSPASTAWTSAWPGSIRPAATPTSRCARSPPRSGSRRTRSPAPSTPASRSGSPATAPLPPSYVAAQGTALGRAGRVHVDTDPDGTIWVGGATVTTISGGVDL